MHYKTRANVYIVLGEGGGGLVGSCFLLFVFGGWGVFHVLLNLLVALVFGCGVPNFCNF